MATMTLLASGWSSLRRDGTKSRVMVKRCSGSQQTANSVTTTISILITWQTTLTTMTTLTTFYENVNCFNYYCSTCNAACSDFAATKGTIIRRTRLDTKLIRRWDSKHELSVRRHRTRTTKYNRLVHKFRHRSTRLCVGTLVYQIQWNNAI